MEQIFMLLNELGRASTDLNDKIDVEKSKLIFDLQSILLEKIDRATRYGSNYIFN